MSRRLRNGSELLKFVNRIIIIRLYRKIKFYFPVFGLQTFLNDSMNFKNSVTERNLIYKYIRFNIKTIKFRYNYK